VDGAPKKAVSEPCLSFFGADGDTTAAEMEEAAFRLTFIFGKGALRRVDPKWHAAGVKRGLDQSDQRTERHREMKSNLTVAPHPCREVLRNFPLQSEGHENNVPILNFLVPRCPETV
jgi:hypothetical protein